MYAKALKKSESPTIFSRSPASFKWTFPNILSMGNSDISSGLNKENVGDSVSQHFLYQNSQGLPIHPFMRHHIETYMLHDECIR